MSTLRRLIVAFAALAGCYGFATPPASGPAGAEKASVKALADAPAKFAGKTVVVEGTLVNEGKNYFTDLRVVVQDDSGEKIYVSPWVPTELPPGPPGQEATRPTLSQFLGKRVELTGTLEKRTLRSVGETHQLVVKEARILQ